MKYLILFLCVMGIQFSVKAESSRAFLEGSAFDKFCEKIIIERPPFEAIGSTWSHIYQLRNPSFSETKDYLYLGVKNPILDKGDYTIFQVAKSNPEIINEFYQLKMAPRDIVVSENVVWALYERTLLKVDLEKNVESEIRLSNPEDHHRLDHAYDMLALNGKLYITHGTLGLIVVDQNSMSITRTVNLGLLQSNGHKSLAGSVVAVSDHELIIGVDNLTVPIQGSQPFNGLVSLNLHSYSNSKYPYQSGIISKHSRLNFDGKTLWINNLGTLQFLNLESLKKNGAAYTGWINMTYFEGDKKFVAEPRGDFFVLGKDVFTCSVRSRLMITKREPKIGIAYRIRNAGSANEFIFSKLNLKVDFKWISGPFVSDYKLSTLEVNLKNDKGEPMSLPAGLNLDLYAFMPSMGHGAFDMGYFVEKNKGTYLNSDIMLGMAGDWIIELKVYDQNSNQVDSVKIEQFM